MDVQEELDSYEGTLCKHCGLGKGRVPAEFGEIGRTNGSMTKLVMISRNTGLTTGLSKISSTMLTTTSLMGIGSKETYIANMAGG